MSPDDDAPYAVVVDDDDMVLDEARIILEQAGFNVFIGMSEPEAVEIFTASSDSINLLFASANVGGSGRGYLLARQVCDHWPWVKILIAADGVDPRPGELPEGATFVKKPFSAQVVYDRLQELLPDGEKPEPLKNGKVAGA